MIQYCINETILKSYDKGQVQVLKGQDIHSRYKSYVFLVNIMHLLINIFYEHIKRLWMKEVSLEIGTSKIHGYAKYFVESSQES